MNRTCVEQLARFPKKNLDIDRLNEPELMETQIPILEQGTGSELDTNRVTREVRKKRTETVQSRQRKTDQRREQKQQETMRRAETTKSYDFFYF